MFNANTIKDCLSGLIGFRQTYSTGVDRLDADVVASLSGITIDQSTHPLITYENIICIAEMFSKTNVVAWSGSIPYVVGDIVKYGTGTGIIYRCIQAGTNKQPDTQTTYWTATNLISAFLRRILQQSSINLFTKVFAERELYNVGKTILTDTSLYDGTGSLVNKITKMSRFVGYRIKPKYKDTVVYISSVGLQLSEAAPDFKLYLYQQSSLEYDSLTEIDHTKVTTFGWHELGATIDMAFNRTDLDDACAYYIGYYEDDLPSTCQAIWKQDINWNDNNGCASCNNVDSYLYRRWSNFFDIQPIYVESTWLNEDRTMFDISKIFYLKNQNWGMNFKMEAKCDVSDFICRQKMAFTNALQLQVVNDLLNEMGYSMRDNQQKGKVSQMAFYALENKENKDTGVKSDLAKAVKGVNFNMSEISSVCLPCMDGNIGIELTSVYGHTASS